MTTSLGTMVKQLCGMIGTADLSEWEAKFVDNLNERTRGGQETRGLSEKQVAVVESIWKRNFA